MAQFHDTPQWRPRTIVWARYGKQPMWPSAVEFDRAGEAKVKFLGLHTYGDVPRESLVRFAEGFDRYSRRCKRADFVIGLKEAITRFHQGLSGDFKEAELAEEVLSEDKINLFLSLIDKEDPQELAPLATHRMYKRFKKETEEGEFFDEVQDTANAEIDGQFYKVRNKLVNGRPMYIHHTERYFLYCAKSLYVLSDIPEYQKFLHLHHHQAVSIAIENNVDPDILDLDEDHCTDEWVICDQQPVPRPDGKGLTTSPGSTIIARALSKARSPSKIEAGWVINYDDQPAH
eukprot:g941.t1